MSKSKFKIDKSQEPKKILHVENLYFYDEPLLFIGKDDKINYLVTITCQDDGYKIPLYCAVAVTSGTVERFFNDQITIRQAFTTEIIGKPFYGNIMQDPGYFYPGEHLPEDELVEAGVYVTIPS